MEAFDPTHKPLSLLSCSSILLSFSLQADTSSRLLSAGLAACFEHDGKVPVCETCAWGAVAAHTCPVVVCSSPVALGTRQ